MTLHLFLSVLAIVLLALAAFKVPEPTWLTYGWAGLALMALGFVVNGLPALR